MTRKSGAVGMRHAILRNHLEMACIDISILWKVRTNDFCLRGVLHQKKKRVSVGVMLDIPSQYMHYCLGLLCGLLCYCVRDKNHCCVLCDVTRDLLFTWYIVHQPSVANE